MQLFLSSLSPSLLSLRLSVSLSLCLSLAIALFLPHPTTHQARGEAVVKEIADHAKHSVGGGGKAVFIAADVSLGKAEVERLFKSCIDATLHAFSSPSSQKTLLGWFNNAGVTQDLEPGIDDDLASVGKHAASMFEINVLAPIYALECCVEYWNKNNITGGLVVQNSSIAGIVRPSLWYCTDCSIARAQ